MKTTSHFAGLILCALLASRGAQAMEPDETKVLAALKSSLPGTQFNHVSRTPVPDLYLVEMGDNHAFVSARDTRYLLFGNLFDTATLRDVTQASRTAAPDAVKSAAPTTASVEALPWQDALKVVRGNGSRRVVVFSDPGCPYCKRLESELAGLDDVTIYTFLVPFFGRDKPAAIWCAPDREKAWLGYMTANVEPPAAPGGCAAPLERNRALAERLGIRGTPALFLGNGQRIDGYRPLAELEAKLGGGKTIVGTKPGVETKERM